jgi:hypothetical protein
MSDLVQELSKKARKLFSGGTYSTGRRYPVELGANQSKLAAEAEDRIAASVAGADGQGCPHLVP